MSEKFDNLKARSRYFRVLLYPDNPSHAAALEIIKDRYANSYVGIVHRAIPDIEKEHIHIVLWFDNPRRTESICRVLGFVDPTDLPDDKFVRAVVKSAKRRSDRQLRDCCIYLIHKNAPEKEQYDISDLFGSPDLIEWVRKQVIKYDLHELDMSDSVMGVLEWISHQEGYISAVSFGRWLCQSPYFRANNTRIVWAVLKEHNVKIYHDKNPIESDLRDIKDSVDSLNVSPDELSTYEDLFLVFGE